MRNELFRSEPLDHSLRQWLSQAAHAAEQLRDEEAVQMDRDEWATYIVARFAIEPLVLHKDKALTFA